MTGAASSPSFSPHASQKSSYFRYRRDMADAPHRLGGQRSRVAIDACRRAVARYRSSQESVGKAACPNIAGDFQRVRSSRHDAFAAAADVVRCRLCLWMGARAPMGIGAVCGISVPFARRLADALGCAALLATANTVSFAAVCDDGVVCRVVRCRRARRRHVAMVVSVGLASMRFRVSPVLARGGAAL
jgi:hypothetical protein